MEQLRRIAAALRSVNIPVIETLIALLLVEHDLSLIGDP